MKAIGILTVTLVCLAGGTVLSGVVLSVLWEWFVVDVFGLPVLTIGQAIGVSMVTSFLTYQFAESVESKKEFTEKLAEVIGASFFRPIIYLAFGWVIRAIFF